MTLTLELPESTIYHAKMVLIPILKKTNQENDEIATELERAIDEAIKMENENEK